MNAPWQFFTFFVPSQEQLPMRTPQHTPPFTLRTPLAHPVAQWLVVGALLFAAVASGRALLHSGGKPPVHRGGEAHPTTK